MDVNTFINDNIPNGKKCIIYGISSKIKQTINYKIEDSDCSFAYTLLLRDKQYNMNLYEQLIYEIAEEILWWNTKKEIKNERK